MVQKSKTKYRQVCIDCGERKPLGQFYRNQFLKSGRNRRCKECYDQWQEDNLDALLTSPLGTYVPQIEITISGTMKENKTRICRWCKAEFDTEYKQQFYCSPGCKAQSIAASRFVILRRDGFRCVYCGARPLDDENIRLHVDHIIPRAAEGPDIADNLVAACSRCNLEKSARHLGEFETELLLVIAERNKQHGIDGNMYIKVG